MKVTSINLSLYQKCKKLTFAIWPEEANDVEILELAVRSVTWLEMVRWLEVRVVDPVSLQTFGTPPPPPSENLMEASVWEER